MGTYSIVAVDRDAGQLGAAVQTHWFGVGALVPWVGAGVGAVATQANVDVSYGPRGLELLAQGRTPEEAVAELVEGDPGGSGRQLAIVDAEGRVAAYTGPDCIPFAGHEPGEAFSCQANLMASEDVWPAMAGAYRDAKGTLAERLLAALDAGQAAGGDVRGSQSAAIEIAPLEGRPWERVLSLRVDDHPEPLRELRRLFELQGAYVVAEAADWALGEEQYDRAAALYEQAMAIAPGNHELLFWAGLGAAQAGRVDEGEERVRQAIELHPGWSELLGRLPASFFPSAVVMREALGMPAVESDTSS
jgi:uncharacterized Ntn-hydrolase superfamily protein